MYRSLLIPLSTGARLHAAETPCSSRHLGVCQELHKVLSVLSQQFGSIILWAPFAWIQWMEEGTAQLAASSQRASKLGETEKAQAPSSPWVTNAQGLMLSTPGFNFKQRMNMTNQYFSNAETIQNIFYPHVPTGMDLWHPNVSWVSVPVWAQRKKVSVFSRRTCGLVCEGNTSNTSRCSSASSDTLESQRPHYWC